MVVPALAAVMSDTMNPRTQSHAAAAFINFCYRCDEDIIVIYLEPLLTKLYSLLQTGHSLVQKEVCYSQSLRFDPLSPFAQALTAIAAVANSVGTNFTKFYDSLMPNLLQIIIHCKGKDQRSLRCKAIECVSVVGSYSYLLLILTDRFTLLFRRECCRKRKVQW